MALIYLTGYRGCGKSTLGRLLASRIDRPFYDLDECLCERQHATVATIVAKCGWEGFRRLEAENLRAITREAQANGVVATGGGIVLAPENRAFMREHGRVFWLDAPVATLWQRLRADPLHAQRPSLTGEGLLEEIAKTLHERRPFYAQCAHHVVDAAASSDLACDAIIQHLKKGGLLDEAE